MAKMAKGKPKIKKHKKKAESEELISVPTEWYCHGCKLFVRETIAELRGKRKESDVIDVMSTICHESENIKLDHKFPYGEAERGCLVFAGDWDE